jgi:hypothetical protein
MPIFSHYFPFFFVALWITASFMISKMGWSKLADRYETNLPFEGTRVGIISATINGVSYKNSLILRYNQDGLYLRPTFLFRLFHKPLFIPWMEIKSVRERKMIFVTWKELVIGEPFVGIIGMSASAFSNIEQYLMNFSK